MSINTKNTEFVGVVTFDAPDGHAGITKKLEEWGFKKKTCHGYALPNNTYLGEFSENVEINSSGGYNPSSLHAVCNKKSDYYRGELKNYFTSNGIDGHVYVLFSWKLTFDDSVTI